MSFFTNYPTFQTPSYTLGFKEATNTSNLLEAEVGGYRIFIKIDPQDIAKSTIDFGPKITVQHAGVSNLSREENIVQLECVFRLLRKGYKPGSIHLEKTYKLGHNEKGRLDICITLDGAAWALIECKTMGQEYTNEKARVLNDGGQIFSYFAQDRTAKVIGIYASTIHDGVTTFVSEQVLTNDLDSSGDIARIHSSWDKRFTNNGIFDKLAGVYETARKNLRKNQLIDLNKETGKSLFNNFAEILRKHVISDKSNAFNVIFNLFVCKIYDEDIKSDTEELDFQIKVGDDDNTLLARLSLLYKESVGKYLSLSIDDKYFATDDRIALKEFQFVDIYNDATFYENAKILSEVVEILQKYRIKYSTKHQFLGDFFESLLHTGVKQESGQYFTSIPLARFILKALPLMDIVNEKIKAKEPYILPHIIDYACGAGHFLTEGIDEINSLLPQIRTDTLSGQQKRFFDGTKDNYLWARDYIYGIEKDHRLAKTTKIAMFLNGDGDAFVLSGDGLDDFYYSGSYNHRLKAEKPTQVIGTFDAVASNPPFSVDGFLNNVKNPLSNFSSALHSTQKSTEIECFFIERTIQLLREGGVAGIILPLSILSNNRVIYVNARKLLLLFTEVVAVVELREKTFMATGTTACIVFFRRRKKDQLSAAGRELVDSLSSEEQRIEAKTQVDALIKSISDGFFDSSFLQSRYLPYLIDILNSSQQLVMSFSGEKKRQEFFLGYRFSKARGREGMSLLKSSLLYNAENEQSNPKLADFIRMAFQGDIGTQPEGELAKHLCVMDLVDVYETGGDYIIKNPSSLLAEKTIKIESISPHGDFIDDFDNRELTLGELVSKGEVVIGSGLIYSKTDDEVPQETHVRVLTASNMSLRTGRLEFGSKMIHLRDDYPIASNYTVQENDIIICTSSGSLRHLGKVSWASQNYPGLLIGGFLSLIRAKDRRLGLAIYYRLMSKQFRDFVFSKKGQNINNLKMSEVQKVQIRIPKDLDSFCKKVDEICE